MKAKWSCARESSGGGIRHKGSVNLIQTVVWNVGTCRPDDKGEIQEEAVRLIKRDSCRYAKRQMTWFAADREVGWLDPGDVDAASKRIGLFLKR